MRQSLVLSLGAGIAALIGFGQASAGAADFDEDGRADLAIGVPNEAVGSVDGAGAVHVLYGADQGFFDFGRDLLLTQDAPMIVGDGSERGDDFGEALAAGDFDGDDRSDLVVAASTDRGRRGLGVVHVLYGGKRGFARNRLFDNATPGIPARRNVLSFGKTMAAGDFNGDGFDDLAARVSLDPDGDFTGVGVVRVLYGSKRGLTTRGAQLLSRVPADLGGSLAVGDFDRDRRDDLALSSGADGGGAVEVLYGSRRGLNGKAKFLVTHKSQGLAGRPVIGGFGMALISGDFDGDGFGDLAIGAPAQVNSQSSDGDSSVHILYGSGGKGVSLRGDQVFKGQAPPDDDYIGGLGFGRVLAAGDVDGKEGDDLAVSGPSNVTVLYSTPEGLGTDASQSFEEDTPGMALDGPSGDFGESLSIGDFSSDGYADLSIGSTVGQDAVPDCGGGGGGVHVLAGTPEGLTLEGNIFLTQDTPGIEGDGLESCDAFGAVLLNPGG